MPKMMYALEPDGPKCLEISWKMMWKDLTIRLDDQVIGVISNQKQLSAGQQFALPDGSVLSVKLVQKFSGTELQVLRHGQPLPGSASDPETRLKNAYGIVFFIAGLNLFLGLITWLFQIEFLQDIGIGFYSIAFGLVFLVLGFFIKRRSAVALIIAVVIFVLDALLGLLAGGASSVTALLVRVILITPMVQGVGAIRALKQRATAEYY